MQDTAGPALPGHSSSSRTNPRSVAIRNLNDRLRVHGAGGIVLMTDGVAAHDLATVNRVFIAVAKFTRFDDANDPFGEHDCGALELDGIRLIWKIDYYDLERRYGSTDPADPKVTTRVLTVMLADEY